MTICGDRHLGLGTLGLRVVWSCASGSRIGVFGVRVDELGFRVCRTWGLGSKIWGSGYPKP